ncbi:MAG: hypothetical protein PHY47_10475 [Lachnospiraceae bacterium]|nr:hypothetical protein [Lachnospiraceae bacterium]
MKLIKYFHNKLHSTKIHNEGSAIIMVIVVMALVGILVSVSMWLSMTNYMMKATDKKAKDTFYSSETVMEQILVGLQGEASDALEKSYLEVMQHYSEFSTADRQNLFYNRYKFYLEKALKGSSLSTNEYDINLIVSYIDDKFFTGGYVNKMKFENDTSHDMEAYSDHILIKNIRVEFTDPTTNYTSIISTDFCMDFPNLDFTQSSIMPDLFDFSLVAGDSLVTQNGIEANIEGNVYGGVNGISLSQNDKVSIKNSKLIITDGSISLNGIGTASNAADLKMGSVDGSTQIWADSVSLEGGNCTLTGKTFLSDDLSIDGSGGKATLEGEFYGYGDSATKADDSSAILINSKNASLDISDVDKFVVGGYAYVGTGSVGSASSNNADILMGESIAIKGNQIAYLVPSSCIGVLTNAGEQKVIFGKNPLTKVQYEELQTYVNQYKNYLDPTFDEVALNKSTTQLGTTIDHYGASFKKVFVPSNGDTLVYYYLAIDQSKVNDFFKDYYGIDFNKEKLDKYYKFYSDAIKVKPNISDYTRIYMGGNWLVDSADQSNIIRNDPVLSGDGNITEEAAKYGDMFAGYCTKLVPAYNLMSSEEKSKSVFENLILTTKFKTDVGTGGTKRFVDDSGILNAVFKDGNITYPTDSAVDANTRLIIATGDVTVESDFTGLIMAQGKITLNHNAQIKPNKDDLAIVLQLPDSVDATKKPITYFTNSAEYVLSGTNIGTVSDNSISDTIELNKLVRYENWKKK